MKVHEVMTAEDLRSCHPTTTLAEAATMMWERDCGAIPIIDEQGHLKGIITDRDICIAVATRGKLASEIRVGEVINAESLVHTCHPNDSVKSALKTMQRAQVRRLPVVNDEGVLSGILSINDIIRHAAKSDAKKILRALKAIGARIGEQTDSHNSNNQTSEDAEILAAIAAQSGSL